MPNMSMKHLLNMPLFVRTSGWCSSLRSTCFPFSCVYRRHIVGREKMRCINTSSYLSSLPSSVLLRASQQLCLLRNNTEKVRCHTDTSDRTPRTLLPYPRQKFECGTKFSHKHGRTSVGSEFSVWTGQIDQLRLRSPGLGTSSRCIHTHSALTASLQPSLWSTRGAKLKSNLGGWHISKFSPPFLQAFNSRARVLVMKNSPRQLHDSSKMLSLENEGYQAYLESLVDEYEALCEAQMKGSSFDRDRFLFLESVAMLVKELKAASAELSDLDSMLAGEKDAELQAMAQTDISQLHEQTQKVEMKLMDLLVGTEPADKNNIMLEVSAGVGGQEAMLFTEEIFNMYSSYAYFKGWTFQVVDGDSSGESGGLRRGSALITGVDVYKHFKFEAGVHRVQRVPKTEKSGRIHTSTMTVAVLPQPSQVDISISPKDLHIDTYRAGGAGGQHVNKTESAVRITHKPTGTVAECQQDRSQIRNKDLAMNILLSRLYQKQVEEQEAALRRKRKLQVGSKGRSEKIRTYNYSQDRITDHRGPITFYNVQQFLSGQDATEDLIQNLMLQSSLEVLKAMVDNFLESRKHKK